MRLSMILKLVLGSTAVMLLIWLLLGRSPAEAAASFPPPDESFTMADGTVLPARLWRPPAGVAPAGVILALHGFTDSRDAWEYPAPAWSAAGYLVIAPDQRGFGATATRGVWAGSATLLSDAASLVAQVRAAHPGQRLVLIGESMGAALIVCLAAQAPHSADSYILSAPAVWGPDQFPPVLRFTLNTANVLVPQVKLTGREVKLEIAASDNIEALRRLTADPLTIKVASISMLHGLVQLMGEAQDYAALMPENTLVLTGKRDRVVPQEATAAFLAKLNPAIRRAAYNNGFHLLLRDRDRALPQADILAWLKNPQTWLPSGGDIVATLP